MRRGCSREGLRMRRITRLLFLLTLVFVGIMPAAAQNEPDLVPQITQTGNLNGNVDFLLNTSGTVTATVSNVGGNPTTAPITADITLAPGLNATSATRDNSFIATNHDTTVQCINNDVLPG